MIRFNTIMYDFDINGWRYGVGLPCRHFHLTTTVFGKLNYTACYAQFII